MELIQKDLHRYAEAHTSRESDLLGQINRQTHADVLRPQMLSGHLQGRLLAMISQMIQPQVILEIGTYTGYSALCMAEGLRPDGKLITLDINEELEGRVREYFSRSGFGSRIDYRIGNALELIPQLTERFDLVFIDADKENYPRYYDLVINRVNLNGFILADNVLRSGKVLDEKPDKDTRAILEFNKKVHQDDRVENLLLPVRDGIMVLRKVKE
jgi:caffeoyl-CoA O-methyltransferase